MKNLQMLKELTTKKFNKSSKSTKSTNEFIIEVLKNKRLTRVEMTFEISLLRYEELTGRKLTDQETESKDFAKSWDSVLTTVKNSIDTNISKNNREPQYNEFVLKSDNKVYFLELKK
jgi:hypothetical protein